MVKNEVVRLEVTGFTNEGNGVGKLDGMVVFVPQTAVGDIIDCRIVKVKSSYAYGIIEKIISPSASRTEPKCAFFNKCGGCDFCHISYSEELKIKENFVKDSFKRIGGFDIDFEPILACERQENYRNKAQYPVCERDGRLSIGFYARRSHRVIGDGECLLQPKIFKEIADFALNYCRQMGLSAYDEETNSGDLRHIYLRRGEHSGEIMLCLVLKSRVNEDFSAFAKAASDRFSDIKSVWLNFNKKSTNVILGDRWQKIFGKDYIIDNMCGREFRISPQSFYQVNTLQAERLYRKAAEYAGLKKGEILLDLYCGIGTVGLCVLGEGCRLIGVEIISQAIENAKENARLNGFSAAEFYCGDAGQVASRLEEKGEKPDVIIADPARKGCDRLALESIVRMSPQRVVMISCNHATAARDCRYLCDNGYKIERGCAVDLFPRTGHVECVVLLSRLM